MAKKGSKITRRKKTDFAKAHQGQAAIAAQEASYSEVVADGGGLRYNAEKCRIELVPPEWIWALGDVLTQGAKKYAVRNWERGMKWAICIGCISRHVIKFVLGERYDDETGCHHMAMAAWNCLALMSYDLRGVGENDLPKADIAILKLINSGKGTNDAKRAA